MSRWVGLFVVLSVVTGCTVEEGGAEDGGQSAQEDGGPSVRNDAGAQPEPPKAPSGVTVEVLGEGTAKVTWTASENADAAHVSGYRITLQPGGEMLEVAASETSVTFTGLSDGVQRTAVVEALSPAGSSPSAMAAKPFTTGVLPNAPSQVVAVAGKRKLSVHWQPPSTSPGLEVTGYALHTTPASKTLTLAASVTSTEIDGLGAGVDYVVFVRSENAIGLGPAAESNAVTPFDVPSAPSVFNAERGDREVVLSWAPPTESGALPLTNYRLAVAPPLANFPLELASSQVRRTVTGLTNGTSYQFTLTALNAAGESASASASVVPAALPQPPTSVTGQPEDGAVLVSWTAPTNTGGISLLGYTVTTYAAGVATGSSDVSGNITQARMSMLTNGTAYTFRVQARNEVGLGAASAASASVRPRTLPSAPVMLSAQGLENGILSVLWNEPASTGGSPLLRYWLRVFDGATLVRETEISAQTLSASLTGFGNGVAYRVDVVAENAAGRGPASNRSAEAIPYTLPNAPLQPQATAGFREALVRWSAPSFNGGRPVIDYTVRVYVNGGLYRTHSAITGTQVTVTGLTEQTRYTFTVAARNDAGNSTPTSEVEATPYTTPTPPNNVVAQAGDKQITVTWQPPTSDGGNAVSGYVVTLELTGAQVELSASTRSATFTGLTNGTNHRAQIRARNAAGLGDIATSPYAKPMTVPGVPTAVSATPDDGRVQLTWSAPQENGGSNILGYVMVVSQNGALVRTDDLGVTTGYTVYGLNNGELYAFTVAARNEVGTGNASTEVAARPRRVPDAPASVNASAGDKTANVTWTAPLFDGGSAILEYEVQSGAGVSQSADANARSQTWTGLTNGWIYNFRVRARNVAGWGPYTGYSVTVIPKSVPSAPTAVQASAGFDEVFVRWTEPTDKGGGTLASYVVTASTGQQQTVAVVTNPSTTFRNLPQGATYRFSVRALNEVGSSAESALSAPLSVSCLYPGFPSLPAARMGFSPNHLVAGDFDGDGKLDVASGTDSNPQFTVMKGLGNGLFRETQTLVTPSTVIKGTTSPIGTTDLNGDGKLDLVILHSGVGSGTTTSGKLATSLGNGDGTFQGEQLQDARAYGLDPHFVDLNGDGRRDVAFVSANAAGGSIHFANADGSFTASTDFFAGKSLRALAVGDVNGDGRKDLIVGTYDFKVQLIPIGPGGAVGTEVLVASQELNRLVRGITVGDLNGDGRLELIYAEQSTPSASARIAVVSRNLDGTFTAPTFYPLTGEAEKIAAGDFNFDGKIDIVATNGLGVALFPGNGNGTLGTATSLSVMPSVVRFFLSADFNGDGKLDLATTHNSGTGVSFLLSGPNGLRQPERVFESTDVQSTAAGDFNKDGRVDLAVSKRTTNNVQVLLANASGGYQPAISYAAGTGANFIVSGDLNGDGNLDLVVANSSAGTISVLNGSANGTFAAQVPYSVGTNPQRVALVDANEDGRLDVVTANRGSNTVSVLLGQAGGALAPAVSYATGPLPQRLVTGDLNGDGHADLLVVNDGVYTSDNTYSAGLFYGNGDGSFASEVRLAKSFSFGGSPAEAAIADLDGDGFPELLTTTRTSGSLNWASLLPGSTKSGNVSGLGVVSDVKVLDANADGIADVLLASATTEAQLLLGRGGGTFASPIRYFATLGQDARVFDFNSDGRPDWLGTVNSGWVVRADQVCH